MFNKLQPYTDVSVLEMYQSGVYSITNTKTKEQYIGSTVVTFYNRWWHHLQSFIGSKQGCRKLVTAVTKYGVNNFKFEIIEVTPKDITRLREQFWVDKLQPEYNIAKDVNTIKGISVEATRVPVMQFDLKGKFIKQWDSCSTAAKVYKVTAHSINAVSGPKIVRDLSVADHIWIRNRYFTVDLLQAKVKRINNRPYCNVKNIEVFDYNTKKLLYSFETIQKASQQLKINSATIIKCCQGHTRIRNKDFIFKYKKLCAV